MFAQDDIDVGAGFRTPASALGEALLKRVLESGVLRMDLIAAFGAGVRSVVAPTAPTPQLSPLN